jgi:CBS domain-containing protein
MTIADVARTEVVTVTPDAPLDEIGRLMQRETIGCVVVLDDGKPRGVVTDRDVAVYGVGSDRPAEELLARNVMEENLFHVDVDDSVRGVIKRMRRRSVRRVPVTDDGELAGIVTLDDLLVLLADELADLAAVIESESPPYR